jgi:hypothetical protein
MAGMRFFVAAVCIGAAGAAVAQGVRTSSLHLNSSMTFHQYLEPFPSFDNAEACRDACVAYARCSGWTWYENIEANDSRLRRVCIMGAGLKDQRIGNAPGRHAGLVAVR